VTRERAQLGMAMFLIAEAVLFFLLILAFVYFGAIPNVIASPGWLCTALLLASSLSMWRAAASGKGDSRLWLWVTIALGGAFLADQTIFFGTTYFTLAGIHGLHILAGLIALAIVPVRALRTMALYWYFFVLVWLAIFLVVYVWGIA
jgi:heme/copper-type cytochrome/quinol oxidase subunit 3